MNAGSKLDPQALQLNETIVSANPAVLDMLSARGKAVFFPKLGILSQSAEADGKKINATIGIAKEDSGAPMFLDSVNKSICVEPSNAYPYAPSYGTPEIRKLWKSMQSQKNPGLENKPTSLPVVTHALTHGLSMAGYLFTDAGDKIILPDKYWENYELTFTVSYGAALDTFETFTPEGGFNIKGLEDKLSGPAGKKVVLLNFPNNPTGYTPTVPEVKDLAAVFKKAAEAGNKIVVLIDDAYFGLVFEDGVYKQSIFMDLCDLHENLLAIKMDGATKEDYVWGIRIGFITYGIKGGTRAMYTALEAKTAGAVRGTISNASKLGQSILTASWSSSGYQAEKKEKFNTLKNRYEKIKSILAANPGYKEEFEAVPFNSGYFMCIRIKKGDAEAVRQELLKNHSSGVIAFGDLIRVAFSATPASQLEALFSSIYQAAKSV